MDGSFFAEYVRPAMDVPRVCRRRKLMASGSSGRGGVRASDQTEQRPGRDDSVGGWIIRSNTSGCAPTRSSRSRSFSLVVFGALRLPSGMHARDLRSIAGAGARDARGPPGRADSRLRATKPKQRRDRRLVDGFNQMLTNIQRGDESVARQRGRFRQVAENIREVFWHDQRHQER